MSEEASDIPSDLLESIKDAVGRKTKLTLKKKVKLESKGDKLENRVLALSFMRAYLLTTRLPSKVEQSFNYLEIQGITSNKLTQVIVEHDKGSLTLKMSSSDDVDEVVAYVGSYLQAICPGLSPVKLMKRLTMEPDDRVSYLQTVWENSMSEPGPCGGFSLTYRCVCDWLGLPYRDEVQWDVDTIYLTQDTKELNLQDFIHLDNRDLVAILAVLEYSQWFTKLSLKDYRLPADVCDQILRVVARSSRLEELVLDNTGLKIDFAQKLANALVLNPSSGLHSITLANNSLEDRGMAFLSAHFAKMRTGLKHINFSRTSLSPKGVNVLAQFFGANQLIPSTLIHLDLSGNVLRGDDIPNLYNFLGHPNSLKTLDLSDTDCSLEQLCSSLVRGSLQHLSVLNVSRSVFPHRKGREIPPSFKQFFTGALALSSVNMSGTKLPPEALKALLLGLACNPNLKDVSLDLSGCELKSGGSQILEGCIAEIPNISSLDISDNGLDLELTTLLVWLAKNRSIRHLALGKNFNNIKSKNLAPVLDNLVHLIQEEDSPLTSLSLADSKLKNDLSVILNALGSNTSLTKVDISGNSMGDMGAKMLAKALQINTKLRTVIWDKNNVSPSGLQDVAAALEKNFTLRFMPVPIVDAAQALKASPERTEEALLKIENYLFRNHQTRKYLQGQAYRLQQGIVTTTSQQVIDRICVKIQDHLNSLRYSDVGAIQEDMKVAESFMKDAKNSKRLLPNLYYLGASCRDDANGSFASPIHDKLESMAGEVTRVMEEQLQSMLESMVAAVEGVCPRVMKKPHLRQELMKAGAGRMVVPHGFVKSTLLEQTAVDIINKMSDVKLSTASFLSDHIVDEILESLSRSQHILAEHLARKGPPPQQHEPVEAEPQEERVSVSSNQEPAEAERLEELEACMVTSKAKRKSIHNRMLRPVSRAFELEFDLDKALEGVPIHIEDLPLTTPPPPPPPMTPPPPTPPPPPPVDEEPPLEVIEELPSEETGRLQHYTKLRPKRNKKLKSSNAALPGGCPTKEDEVVGVLGKLDEGVDEFFNTKINKMGTKQTSLKSSGSLEQERRRESRKSGFLNLIMSRSSRHEKGLSSVAAQVSLVVEDPLSPPLRCSVASAQAGAPSEPSKVPEPKAQGLDLPRAVERTTEPKGLEAVEHRAEGEGRASPLGAHRGRVQVMGTGFLAEMKAKQEKRAAGSHKILNSSPCTDKPAGGDSGHHPTQPDTQVAAVTALSEKPPQSDSKPEATPRSRTSSNNPSPMSPKPHPLGSKLPPLSRPSVPQKPRSSSSRSLDEHPDSPTGRLSPKVSVLPHRLKSASLDTEKEADVSGDGNPFDSDPEPEKPTVLLTTGSPREHAVSTAQEVDAQENRKSLPQTEMEDAALHLRGAPQEPEDDNTVTQEKRHPAGSSDSEEEP